YHFLALDDVSIFQPYLATRSEPKILRRWRFYEIVALDVKLAAKWNFAGASIWILRIIYCGEFFSFSFRIICQHNFNWPQHGEATCCIAIEFITHRVLKKRHVGHARIFGDPDVVRQTAQGSRRHTAPAET